MIDEREFAESAADASTREAKDFPADRGAMLKRYQDTPGISKIIVPFVNK